MRIVVRLFALFVVVAVAASLTGLQASAHEVRVMGEGRYEVVVGFLDEPAFVGEKNGLDLRVSKLPVAGEASPVAADAEPANTPVEGLETMLQAEVIYGDQTLALRLDTVYNAPGEYASYFFPMAEGDYSFHVFGTVEGVAVDETFTSGPDTFSPIQPRLEFPATTAQVSDDTAGLPAISGALGLAGLAVGGVVYSRRRSVG
ncbi:MAG: hypothetical protein M3P94_06650 [Chloroflexota bacterium]|nr:hypothetical protein [Chloroflexota bacterium]